MIAPIGSFEFDEDKTDELQRIRRLVEKFATGEITYRQLWYDIENKEDILLNRINRFRFFDSF